MHTAARPPANAFVAFARKVYGPLGFMRGYNFVMWFVFGGALVGFTLASFRYLDFNGLFCPQDDPDGSTLPGECYWYRLNLRGRLGIILHLAGVLPAAFLAVFQFLPVIRHRFILFHRISGYLILLLSLVGTVGAIMITRQAFGGGLDTQVASGTIGTLFLGAMTMAYINIKKLQIEQHRNWMLRTWAYVCSLVLKAGFSWFLL
jgi:hypothetical protein